MAVCWRARRTGLIALAVLVPVFGAYAIGEVVLPPSGTPRLDRASSLPLGLPGLVELAAFFFKVGACIFGGGLWMLASIQAQVVNHFGWLTPQEFVDGLAIGQLTPGPVPMLAAFIGFHLAGLSGAAVATAAIYLPSFLMMLSILPLLWRMKDLEWLKAFMRRAGPAVIGALAVSLAQMAYHAAPDIFTALLGVLTVAIVLLRNVGPLPLVLSGGVIGLLRKSTAWERLSGFVPVLVK